MIKKLTILATSLLAIFAMNPAFGQADVSLGIKAGLNFANVDASSSSSAYSSRTGYHAGAFLLAKFTKFGIQPEVVYSQQESTVQYSGQNVDTNFSYLNIPVVGKLYLAGGFNLQLGPQFGFLTSATGPISSSNGTVQTGDIKDTLKGSDISIAMGAGFDLPMKLSIDARYNLGVTDINNSSSSSIIKNQVIQISVGYKLFSLGN